MPPVGRAILPQITLDDFDYFRLAFTSGTETYSARWDGTDGTINLAAGDWHLIVTAYLTIDDYYDSYNLLYSGLPISVTVAPGAIADVDVSLRPVSLAGDGMFTWNVVFPAGTATLTVRNLDNTVAGAPVTITSGVDGDMQLPAGRYNVLIRVVDGTQVAFLGKSLYISFRPVKCQAILSTRSWTPISAGILIPGLDSICSIHLVSRLTMS